MHLLHHSCILNYICMKVKAKHKNFIFALISVCAWIHAYTHTQTYILHFTQNINDKVCSMEEKT